MLKYKIEKKKVKENDFLKIHEMLLSISDFKVDKNLISMIAKEFLNQKNLFAYKFVIDNEIVGYGSFLVELKIRGGKVAHIEDIVVDLNYRGCGIGKFIIKSLVLKAKQLNCYKVTLSCKDKNVRFYEKCGFFINGNTMNILISKT